jgi:hypothetical protein
MHGWISNLSVSPVTGIRRVCLHCFPFDFLPFYRLMIQSLSVCCVIVQLDLICATKGTMDWVQRLKSVNFALIVWFCTALYNHMLVHMLLHSLPTELGAAADAVPGGTASRASWTRPGSPSTAARKANRAPKPSSGPTRTSTSIGSSELDTW